jgi:hypothetical protein
MPISNSESFKIKFNSLFIEGKINLLDLYPPAADTIKFMRAHEIGTKMCVAWDLTYMTGKLVLLPMTPKTK